jgi:predicted RNA-binding Zn-ribbon protein involved in translation (DUF1610 family)
MSDFVTMQCPNCGGKLSIGSNVTSLKCEHCGVEHMIRREAGEVTLESYARCPICNRNDKAEKVTAILRSQTHSAQGITYQTVTTSVNTGFGSTPVSQQVAVPVQTSQMSELARFLTPPAKPEPDKSVIEEPKPSHKSLMGAIFFGMAGAGFSLLTLVIFAAYLADWANIENFIVAAATVLGWFLLALSTLGMSIFLFAFTVPKENRSNREKKAVYEEKVRQRKQENADSDKRWAIAMDRWNQLYYCGRDDCVFLPGAHTHALVSTMAEYLYRP